jgi:Family of unknown function (DUF5329)
MGRLFAIAFLAFAAAASGSDRSPTEDARIEYLLGVVASLHDAQFIRNGTSYDSAAAVKHLRLKLRAVGSRVRTAEDFIRYCASVSSVSGRPYEIRFSNGREVPSADFLRQKLMEFERKTSGGVNSCLGGGSNFGLGACGW